MPHTHPHPAVEAPDAPRRDPGLRPNQPADPAAESLAGALHASFSVLRFIMIALVLAYLGSGVFVVGAGEQGLIARLGRLQTDASGSAVLGQGPHFAWPDPLDEKIRLAGKELALDVRSFMFKPRGGDEAKELSEMLPASRDALKPGVDGAMLSGDHNLSHGIWTVLYRVTDGDRFVTNVGDAPQAAEWLLTRLAENAVVRTVASCRVEDVTLKSNEIADRVRARMQEELTRLDTGITLTKVTARTIYPAQVRDAFARVTNAENERLRVEEEARQREQEILNQAAGATHDALLARIDEYGAAQTAGADPARLAELRRAIDAELELAGGKVAATLADARARANRVRETVRRQFEDFKTQYALYRQNPAVTVSRLWSDMRRRVLESKKVETFFLPQSDEIEIITNRDLRKLMEAERERYRSRTE